jgi:hypothetical protein
LEKCTKWQSHSQCDVIYWTIPTSINNVHNKEHKSSWWGRSFFVDPHKVDRFLSMIYWDNLVARWSSRVRGRSFFIAGCCRWSWLRWSRWSSRVQDEEFNPRLFWSPTIAVLRFHSLHCYETLLQIQMF